jgi:hypothetical protein
MDSDNNRKNQRISTHNLLSYSCFDKGNNPVTQGMGRTLNVSEGGILLETHYPIDPEYTVSISISLEDELMNVNGKVTFSKERKDGKHESGIQFIDTDKDKIRILKQFAEIFKGEVIDQ